MSDMQLEFDDQEQKEVTMLQRAVTGLLTTAGTPDMKHVTARLVDVAARAYLPPGFNAAVLAAMLSIALGSFWEAGRVFRSLY